MNSQNGIPVSVRAGETVFQEIEDMYARITKRAQEIFIDRGGIGTLDLEDWLTAERELVFKPDVRIEETEHQIVVSVYIEGACPTDMELLVTPQAMVIQAEGSAAGKKVFRTITLPCCIDVNKVAATYENGRLVVTALVIYPQVQTG